MEASGFSKKMAKELEAYMKQHGVDGDAGDAGRDDEGGEEDDSEDEDDEGIEADGEDGHVEAT